LSSWPLFLEDALLCQNTSLKLNLADLFKCLHTDETLRKVINEAPFIPGRPAAVLENVYKMPRRQHVTLAMLIAVSAFICITLVLAFHGQAEGTRHPDYVPSYQEHIGAVDPSLLHGAASAPKLENATLK
jgi:hypothetical protein